MYIHFGNLVPGGLAALTVVFISSFGLAFAQQDIPEPATIERDASLGAESSSQLEPAAESVDLQKSDLAAQERMADATVAMNRATQAMMWAAWISVFIGAGGLTALIWTFNEQRKLFRADNQAYVEVTKINAYVHPTYGLTLTIDVANRGKSPASNVNFEGKFSYFRPDQNDYPIQAGLNILPAGSYRSVVGKCYDMLFSFDGLLDVKDAGTHGKWTWQRITEDGDDSKHPKVVLDGEISWEDAYGRRNSQKVYDLAQLTHKGQPMWLGNRQRPEQE